MKKSLYKLDLSKLDLSKLDLLYLYIIIIIITMGSLDRKIWLNMTFSKNADIVYRNWEESVGYRPNGARRFVLRIFNSMYPFVFPLCVLHILLTTKYKNKLKLVTFILNKPYTHPKFEMSLHGSIRYFDSKNVSDEVHSKVFWNDIFEKSKVSTPEIYGYLKNGVIQMNKRPDGKCILKPVSGGFGTGIEIFNEKKFPLKGEYIIQKYIKTDGHHRIVTTHKNGVVSHYFCQKARGKIASNNHSGGKCNSLESQNELIENAKRDASRMHRENFDNIDVIGWDIVISENKYFFLEGNVSAGSVFSSDLDYTSKAKQLYNLIT